jgi:hypothetical protein
MEASHRAEEAKHLVDLAREQTEHLTAKVAEAQALAASESDMRQVCVRALCSMWKLCHRCACPRMLPKPEWCWWVCRLPIVLHAGPCRRFLPLLSPSPLYPAPPPLVTPQVASLALSKAHTDLLIETERSEQLNAAIEVEKAKARIGMGGGEGREGVGWGWRICAAAWGPDRVCTACRARVPCAARAVCQVLLPFCAGCACRRSCVPWRPSGTSHLPK